MCANFGCEQTAVASLTYDYQEATAVLGPLPPKPQANITEFCEQHANSFTVPQGWQVIRLSYASEPVAPSTADIAALAASIRQAAEKVRKETHSR